MEDIRLSREGKEESGVKRNVRQSLALTRGVFSWLEEGAIEKFHLLKSEIDLFFGVALLLIGLLNFESGKYCDGNTAEYLSCTRPATYYYFSAFDIIIIITGVFFILFWLLRARRDRSAKN